MADRLSVRLLGPVEARRGDDPVDLGGPLQRALLACLAMSPGSVVSRERLIDVLWDDDPPPAATRNVETKVSRLRSALGVDAVLVARAGGYVLMVPPAAVDVHRFEQAVSEGRALLSGGDPLKAKARLLAAIDLSTGEPLAGVPAGVLSVERSRLVDKRLEAIEARIDADLALGAGRALVGELEALRAEHPLRERFTEQLMVALYRSGRQADALQAYRAARRAFVDELGLEPSPRLRELEQAILRHDESLGPLPVIQRLARAARTPRAVAGVLVACAALVAVGLAIGSRNWGPSAPQPTPPGPGLILVDAATDTVRADIPLGPSQGFARFGYGFLWTVGSNGVMSQVDTRSRKLVRSIPVGVEPGGIAVGAGGIWITDRNSPALLRIEPLTGKLNLRARLSSLGPRRPGPNGGIALDRGSLWIARGSEALDRLDPATLRVRQRIRLRQGNCGQDRCALAAGEGRVWVAGGDNGTLTGIDERTNRVLVTTKLRPYLCCVAVGGGSVWAAEAHAIAQLTPAGRVVRRFGVGESGIGNIAYDAGSLWAPADVAGDLLRIDARTGRVRTIHLGNLLIGVGAERGVVAVAASAPPTDATEDLGRRVVRIALTQDWLNPTDPALTGSPRGTGRWQWQLHHATCAGLYRQADSAGATGHELVAELASGPPRRSADGRVWKIPLRTGLRFSPPLNRAVTAEDVRSTLVRTLSPQLGPNPPAAEVLRDLVGLRAFRRGTAGDVAGIQVDRGRLVLSTNRPVRDLPARLALPYFCVLPAGIPASPGGYQDPIPTAGPYYLAAHEGGLVAVLRQNPGYEGPRRRRVDALVFQLGVDDRVGPTQVQRGRLDYFAGRREVVAKRIGCRRNLGNVPGLDLAALCLAGQSP